MTENAEDSGVAIVLDNRRLIIAFAVLIAICGSFFVLGFIEGKRQGYQEGTQRAAEMATLNVSENTPAQSSQTDTAESGTESPPAGTKEQPLNWYKNVNRRDSEPENLPRIASGSPAKSDAGPAPATKSTGKPKPSPSAAPPKAVTYSVQVGAFVQQKEAEKRAQEIRSKGFDCRIESPVPPQQLYLLKVGRFDSRADAVATQLRLKKSGFSCFVKTD